MAALIAVFERKCGVQASISFINDLDLFGHVFENMVLRDLLVFAEKHNARVMHYTDDMGVEADAVYQLEDGRYALIEIKTGVNKIPEAEKSLLRFKDIILKYNEKALEKEKHPRDVYKEPSAQPELLTPWYMPWLHLRKS